jgi:hypothetical protein
MTIRAAIRRNYFMRASHDYLRYTLTPATACGLVLGALLALTTILFVLDDRNAIIIIFCTYTTIFSTVMVAGLIGWLKYVRFYKTVFRK